MTIAEHLQDLADHIFKYWPGYSDRRDWLYHNCHKYAIQVDYNQRYYNIVTFKDGSKLQINPDTGNSQIL